MKNVKSSLSSSRLQYPLLMLLLLVMEGVSTVLTVMERSRDGAPGTGTVGSLGEVLVYLENDVTLSHDQSPQASNCPLLIQEKSALLC